MGQRIPVSRCGLAVTAVLLLVFSGCSFGFLSDKSEGQSFVVNIAYPLNWQEYTSTSDSSEARFLTRSSNRLLITLLLDGVVHTSRNINLQFDDSMNAMTGRAEFKDLPFASYEVRAEAFSEDNVLQAQAVGSVIIANRIPVDLSLVLMPHESLVVDIPPGFHYSAAAFLEDYIQTSVDMPQLAAGAVRHFRFSVSASDVDLIGENAVFVFAGDWGEGSTPLMYSLRGSEGGILPASVNTVEDPDDDLGITFITPGSPLSPGIYYISLFNNTNAVLPYLTATGYSGIVDSDNGMDLPFQHFNGLSSAIDGDNIIFSADYSGPVTDNLEYYIAYVSDSDKGLHGPFSDLPVSLAKSDFTEYGEIDWKIVAVLGGLVSGVMHDSPRQSYTLPAPPPDTFMVILDPQDGTVEPGTITVTYGQTYGDLPEPEREGYTFTGWNTESDGSGTTVTAATEVTIAAEHTLYAQWSADTNQVIFNANGGDGTMPDQTIVTGDAQNLNTNLFTRSGYSFTGWNTEADGSGQPYADEEAFTMGPSSVTLYAQWEAEEYSVFLDAQGGTEPGTITVTYGQTYGDLPEPDRQGYTFAGWNTAPDGSGTTVTAATEVTIASNHNLYAQWEGSELLVTIDLINPEEADITFSDASETLSASGTGYPSTMLITVNSSDTIDSYSWLLNGESGNPALTVSPGGAGDHVVEIDAAEGLYLGVHNLSLIVVINGSTFSAQFDFSVVQ
ncbi:InlB B-repeat-containing protein [Spirochaeta dissipatitropha]